VSEAVMNSYTKRRKYVKAAFNIIMTALLLCSCSSGTPYQSRGLRGGYSETQLGENIFRVSFRGNGYTDHEKSADFCLLRAAEVTLENGFRFFIIKNGENGSTYSAMTMPTTSYTTGTVSGNGNSATFNATITTHSGKTMLVAKPKSNCTILCYEEKPKNIDPVFDAKFVANSIRKKYNINTSP
jgi:hypothetical protein